jgi:hypothetical protein
MKGWIYMYYPINIPINIGRNEFSPEYAYFIGAILSADESFDFNGKCYWLAPVRHNYGQQIHKEIEDHKHFLEQIIGRANGILMTRDDLKSRKWFNSVKIRNAFTTKQGFTAIFECNGNMGIDSFLGDIKHAVKQSPKDAVRAFIAGAFDGRSSIDRNTTNNQIRYLSLDCENHHVALFLCSLLDEFGIEYNYNISRDRLEGGMPRKEQLRIKGNNIPLFMEEIGLISPLKFNQIRSMLNPGLFMHMDNRILWGLKTLSTVKQTNIVFESTDEVIIQDYDIRLESMVLEHMNKHPYGSAPHFQYSGKPKEKIRLTGSNRNQVYPRNRSVALNALVLAGFTCEIDESHPSFIRKNGNVPYSESHHLVPVGFHNMFPVSLDIEENIASLCSNCHNHLHYGKDIRPLLHKLYGERYNLLHSVGIDVTLQELFKMYGA